MSPNDPRARNRNRNRPTVATIKSLAEERIKKLRAQSDDLPQ